MTNPTNEPTEPARVAQPEPSWYPLVELRQYTLHPGQRDVLIDLFDRTFIESQEAVGIEVIGQFRQCDHPDRFVWLRGFRDMPSRAQALNDFYGGPVWRTHRDAANATMIDFDNVLLLRSVRPTSGFTHSPRDRPVPGATDIPPGLVVATIYAFDAPVSADGVDFFEVRVAPVLIASGASIVASFVTEEHPNTFPALPVRAGEHVLVWFACFRDQAAYEQYLSTLAQSPLWCEEVAPELTRRSKGMPEVLKLVPTARSLLHG